MTLPPGCAEAFYRPPIELNGAAGNGGKDQTVVAKELERMAGATLGTLNPASA